MSEEYVCSNPHYEYVGETLRTFSRADVRKFQDELDLMNRYRSELDIKDVLTKVDTMSDLTRDVNEFYSQLDGLSRMVKLLSDCNVTDYLKFDGRVLADILSQMLIALKLIACKPSLENIVLVFTCCITKLNISKEMFEKIVSFITDAVTTALASINTLGFKSESESQMISVFTGLCKGVCDLVDDKVIDIVCQFLGKLVAFWLTLSGGFNEDDFDILKMPQVVSKIRSIIADGGDLIEALLGAYDWLTTHFTEFIVGDFSAFYFGKAETAAYESCVSKMKKIYPLIKNGSFDIVKEEYNLTESSYDLEISNLIKTGDRMMKKARDAQKPALKRMLDELREIQTDRFVKKAQTQAKASAVGVCFVGGSGIGKSLLMEQTARTLIMASGEVPHSDLIVSGQMSDKFDSNELPKHLVLMYDDVANNSNNENFDKLLNAVNSQSRPFLKASVEEKGVMFPGNIGCVISTNVLGFNACKSNCADSLGRRFLHIKVEIKESLIEEICTPGTRRIDPVRASANGQRFDIWKFSVYEFVTFEPFEDGVPDGIEVLEGDQGTTMYVRPIEWTKKPEEDQTFWDLALFLKDHAKKHYSSQRLLIEKMMSAQNESYCTECCIPQSLCVCNACSEFSCDVMDTSLERIVENYNTFCSYTKDYFNMVKFRSVLALSLSLCPIDYRKCVLRISGGWLLACFMLQVSITIACTILAIGIPLSLIVIIILAWMKVYKKVSTTSGILSHVAQETVSLIKERRNSIFVGVGIATFAYTVYRAMRPRSEAVAYRELLPEQIRGSFARAEKARTTPIDNILPHMKRDLGVITVKTETSESKCLAFPIYANFYVTVGHIIPKEGEFTVTIVHESAINPTVSKQKLNQTHLYRFPEKDLVMMNIPSAIPRRGYMDFLNGHDSYLGRQSVQLISLDIESGSRSVGYTSLEPAWSMTSNYVQTDRVALYRPYRYAAPLGTRNGMCGSLVVDYSKSLIYGFHVAGNGRIGLCDTLSRDHIAKAIESFSGFVPVNRGELHLGSNSLEKGLGMLEIEVNDDSVDKPIEDHNCIVDGVLPGANATFKDPYRKHPFYKSVVREFGEPTNGPPQRINDPFHKRKALTKLTSPNQEFSSQEVEFARKDYVGDILNTIRSSKDVAELKRILTVQEALDGIGEKSLGGIDNSTSVGFPYKGKKINFLERDPMDPTLPLTPRKLVPYNDIDIMEEVEKMIAIYKSGTSCRPLFKCSMKTNELLPNHKFKARVFMGSNFPFLIVCRMYLAPFIRLASRNKYLFESAKGINMDSVEAEELYNYLKVNEERIVALDYSAFDQTMSAQVSTAVSACIIDILKEMGCSDEHILIVRGILTDINYPSLHFFGTLLQLANSDPSGNPITTELNGGVNSIYLRIFFFRIYPHLKGRVSYREAIRTMTYGDDNISSVPEEYKEFNGFNIVKHGKECGLTITMADKDAEVTAFTHLTESDFLKRKFRYCPDMKRVRAPLSKGSITKSLYYFKKDSPDPPAVLFAQNVDGALRKASQHGRPYFEEVKDKLLRIAQDHEVVPLCKWWGYDELIKHDKTNYYDSYRGVSLAEVADDKEYIEQFLSEAKKRDRPGTLVPLIKLALSMMVIIYGSTKVSIAIQSGKDQMMVKVIAKYLRGLEKKGISLFDDIFVTSYHLNGIVGVCYELGVPASIVRFFSNIFTQSRSDPDESIDDFVGRVFDNATCDEPEGFTSESYEVVASILSEQAIPSSGIELDDTTGSMSDLKEFPFVSESFTPPPRPQKTQFRLVGWIAEIILSLVPFFNTGRFVDLGVGFSTFNALLGLISLAYYTVPQTDLKPYEFTWWNRIGYNLRETIVHFWLTRESEVIREQPACIVLEGPAGSGKTTLALSLIKEIFRNRGGIQKHEIVVLNEEDDFQSEFRTHHRVVILDDVCNTRDNQATSNPLRRVIDFVNNIPKRSLNPEANLKGMIKIRPELVIITSNARNLRAYTWSNCPPSVYRRAEFYIVRKKPKYIFKSGLDLGGWDISRRIKKMSRETNGSGIYLDGEELDQHQGVVFATFTEFIGDVTSHVERHWNEQKNLVKIVNEIFDEPTSMSQMSQQPFYKKGFKMVTDVREYIHWGWNRSLSRTTDEIKFKSESWDADLADKLRDLPRGCGEEAVMLAILEHSTFMAQSGDYSQEEMPVAFQHREPPPIPGWCEWFWTQIKILFKLEKFKSEACEKRLNQAQVVTLNKFLSGGHTFDNEFVLIGAGFVITRRCLYILEEQSTRRGMEVMRAYVANDFQTQYDLPNSFEGEDLRVFLQSLSTLEPEYISESLTKTQAAERDQVKHNMAKRGEYPMGCSPPRINELQLRFPNRIYRDRIVMRRFRKVLQQILSQQKAGGHKGNHQARYIELCILVFFLGGLLGILGEIYMNQLERAQV